MMNEYIVPVTAIVMSMLVVAVAIYAGYRSKEFRHRERMTAMEKGIDLPADPITGPNFYLLRGLVWLFIGIGFAIFLVVMSFADPDPEMRAGAALGRIPAGVGIAYLIVYRVES
ncbi:MAG: hypothetical protein KJZ78_25775, partial [Bryobacteraceae bacterium]|nr:hypothetical protein [Bryobacteraceae bacterium]